MKLILLFLVLTFAGVYMIHDAMNPVKINLSASPRSAYERVEAQHTPLYYPAEQP